MTTVQYILIIIAVVIMVVGLWMIIRALRNRNSNMSTSQVEHDKNGIPIIPRHERNIIEDEPEETTAGETTFIPDRSHLQPVMSESEEDSYNHHHETAIGDDAQLQADRQIHDDGLAQQEHSSGEASSSTSPSWLSQSLVNQNNEEPSLDEDLMDDKEGEEDLFSSLASATESLMPAIKAVDEPEFNENSPMLDEHLLAEADQDQNSPLKNAQENINITLVPKDENHLIDGKTVLSLVDEYGLKYGAMNMFHRYENKEGTGILWFSMMGMTDEGVTPFDLNSLPTSHFRALILFLSLPHPKATQGFDSMMSIVNLISNKHDMLVLDEENNEITRERRQQMRAQLQEYQASFR